MPREKNRKLMGMWMLILRTACLKRRKKWWFVVNGVPVHYSIREHALISGLNCKDYPKDGDNIGSFDFVQRQFKRKNKIFLSDVEKKLKTMLACEDRLHMAVLYLLGSIIKMKAKVPSAIEPFILRIVDDLEVCKSYTWGRYTFEHCSDEIHKLLMSLKGEVKEKVSLTFPAFIILLEILAFEAVDALKVRYREDFRSSHGCPRMCQKSFKDTGMKGYPITDINETLGETKEICSILEPTADEERLLDCIWDENFPVDYPDAVAEGMTTHLNAGGSIFWENLYERDVSARVVEEVAVEAEEVEEEPSNVQRVKPRNVLPPRDIFRELKKLMDVGFSHSHKMMKVIDEKVSLIGEKVKVLEYDVKNLQKEKKRLGRTYFEDFGYNYGYMGGDDSMRSGPVDVDTGMGSGHVDVDTGIGSRAVDGDVEMGSREADGDAKWVKQLILLQLRLLRLSLLHHKLLRLSLLHHKLLRLSLLQHKLLRLSLLHH
ncbi:hypothetical protein V5N11_005386 [Cardamine amara subsp. amara]|uniref:DUF1985 domain-containing protein n=1 Tax=Cardamine amara subsp. amara TaxID=228776 RepID=A0ABD1C8C8_CARAN